jgi:hypothetical protein
MYLTMREFWTAVHGMIFGAVYLLAFAGGFAGLWSLSKWSLTEQGMRNRIRRLLVGLWTMAILCWGTVISGTYIVYPWYRAKIPESPRSQLLADSMTAAWHTFGMEWKEHVAWIAPILATAVVFIVQHYREELAERDDLRRATLVLFVLAFCAAAAAGLFGAFITKVQPLL